MNDHWVSESVASVTCVSTGCYDVDLNYQSIIVSVTSHRDVASGRNSIPQFPRSVYLKLLPIIAVVKIGRAHV